MDKTFIECKLYQYMARMSLSVKQGNLEQARKSAELAVILVRMQAREAVKELVKARSGKRAASRSMAKAKEQGITFALGKQRVKKLGEAAEEKRKRLAAIGTELCLLLDLWQCYGATLWDLANLCNRSYDEVVREIEPEGLNTELSNLVFVYNLDYKDTRGWIDLEVDAPLTHAVKEHWMELVLHTKKGREASHRAMEAAFPEIMENALTMYTDADGVKHLIDQDGVEIGTDSEGE